MSLPPGTRIGVYDVVEMIGVGGMGEVYRARDSRLDRDVALKTLPDEFARDPERLSRFEREAKSLAQLNHPHIASIYGLETGSPTALSMEMVEGETLADRLKGGPLPLDEALVIARQLCAALDHDDGGRRDEDRRTPADQRAAGVVRNRAGGELGCRPIPGQPRRHQVPPASLR